VWHPSLSSIIGLSTGKEYEEITDDTLQGELIDMQDAGLFFVNFDKDKPKLKEIEDALEDYDNSKYKSLIHPVKAGTTCAAKFDTDGKWYRATVERSIPSKVKKHMYEVTFIDYGNKSEVSVDNLKKIESSISQYPPLSHQCSLAFIKVPREGKTFGTEASDYFREKLWGKTCTITIHDEDDYQFKVVINAGTTRKPNESINAYLISEGLASITNSDHLPDDYAAWKDYEAEAKEEQLNIWEIGGGGLDDDF